MAGLARSPSVLTEHISSNSLLTLDTLPQSTIKRKMKGWLCQTKKIYGVNGNAAEVGRCIWVKP